MDWRSTGTYARLLIVEGILALIGIALVLPGFGILGAAWVIATLSILHRCFVTPWLLCRALNGNFWGYMTGDLSPSIADRGSHDSAGPVAACLGTARPELAAVDSGTRRVSGPVLRRCIFHGAGARASGPHSRPAAAPPCFQIAPWRLGLKPMCGIAGMISDRRDEAELTRVVHQMTASMARRGPNDEGFASWPGVALGHRRLSILDLSSAGHQPMLSDDGSVGLVFNGCIYNFQLLREELIARGHRFRSQCDTEVLLRGYQEWGIDTMVPKLRGMFAFGLWDQNKRSFWLVRDRLGVKPLYVCASDSGLAFASTHAALADAGLAGELDPQAVLEFLHWGFVSDRSCIREGVRKVPAGTILKYAGRGRDRASVLDTSRGGSALADSV